ncbi:hypothetical protein P9112_008991 [Eukaryota sp. TZLM1-RC]
MNILRNRTDEKDIPLGLTAMRTYSRGITPSAQAPTKRASSSGGKSRKTPQHKHIPEKHEREGSNFAYFVATSKATTMSATLSRVPKADSFKLGEPEEPASRGSVERCRGRRGRRVSRFRFRGCGGHFRGHKGRGQYRLVYNINTTEDISSHASPTEAKLATSKTVPQRRFNNGNRNNRTDNFPHRIHINAINHNQSATDLENPVNNYATVQQELLIPLQVHQTSSDMNSFSY